MFRHGEQWGRKYAPVKDVTTITRKGVVFTCSESDDATHNTSISWKVMYDREKPRTLPDGRVLARQGRSGASSGRMVRLYRRMQRAGRNPVATFSLCGGWLAL